MSDATHVHEDIRHLLEKSNEERLEYVDGDQWVPYGQAQEGLELLRKTVKVRDQLSPRGVILRAESQMGKSAIIDQFSLENPADDNVEGDHVKTPVLVLQFPDSGGEGVYGEICRRLNVKLPSRPSPLQLRSEAIGVMDDCGVRVLVIDELANVITAKSATAKQRSMNQIKFIMNERRRPIVLGATDEAHKVLCADKQIRNRFKTHTLRRLQAKDISAFVHSWIHLQPLRKPSEIDADFLREVGLRTGGHTGTIVNLLRELVKKAIETGTERVNWELLKSVDALTTKDEPEEKPRKSTSKAKEPDADGKAKSPGRGGKNPRKKPEDDAGGSQSDRDAGDAPEPGDRP